MAEDKTEVGIRVGVTGNTPLPVPEGANYFHFTRAGQEVQFLVGSVNLLRLHEIKELKEWGTVVVPEITHRYLLSPLGFAALKAAMEEIAPSIPASDIPVSISGQKK